MKFMCFSSHFDFCLKTTQDGRLDEERRKRWKEKHYFHSRFFQEVKFVQAGSSYALNVQTFEPLPLTKMKQDKRD